MDWRIGRAALLGVVLLGAAGTAQQVPSQVDLYRWMKKVTKPETPFNLQPSSGSINVASPVALGWEGAGADSYDLYLGTSTTPNTKTATVTTNSYQTAVLNANVKYYWRVIARNAAGASPTSVISNFTTAAPAPPPPPPPGSTFHVSPSGNDSNSCTSATNVASPKATISAGVACASVGDIVLVHAGIYTGPQNVISSQSFTVRSGTSDSARIVISGAPGEIATIRPPAGVSCVQYATNAVSFTTVQDLVCDMTNSVSLPGSNGGADGVYFGYGSQRNIFQRLEIKNNGANGFQCADSNGDAPANQILNNYVHEVGQAAGTNNGYAVYNGCSATLIEGNRFINNGAYDVHSYDNAGAIHLDDVIIRGNLMSGSGTHGGSNAAILVCCGARNLIANNIVVNHRDGGIVAYTNSQMVTIYNNTVYNNRGGGGFCGITMEYYASGPVLQNNIVFNNGAGSICNRSGTGTPVQDHNIFADPLFTNAPGGDFTVRVGSPAIDTGVVVPAVPIDFAGTTRPQGSAYDVGAYER